MGSQKKKIVEGDNVASCEVCGDRFANEHGLLTHTRMKHNPRKLSTDELTALRSTLLARVAGGEDVKTVIKRMGLDYIVARDWLASAVDNGDITMPAGTVLTPQRVVSKARREALKAIMAGGGTTLAEAARILGIGYSTARDHMKIINKEIEDEEAAAEEAERINPAPIAWDELTEWARERLEDFQVFRRDILHRTHNPPWAVIAATQLLELYLSPEDEYVVLNVAPGVGKSTLLTHDFVVWVIARERAMGREPTILLGHRAWQKSTWYVRRVRTTLEHNPDLIRNYGRFKATTANTHAWSQDELDVELICDRAQKEPTVAAGSYDGSLLSGRFTLVVWDDLIEKQNSSTVEAREKLQEWWENDAESRLEPGGLVVLSNARYGPEDLSFTVRQDVDEDDLDEHGQARSIYKHIKFRAHYEELCSGEDHHGDWPDGCLLDERRLNWRRMRKVRTRETRWALVYQQDDVDPTGFLAQAIYFEGGSTRGGELYPGCFHPELQFAQLPEGRSGYPNGPALSAITIDPSSTKFWAIGHWLAWGDRTQLLYRCERRPMQAPDVLYSGEVRGTWVGLLEDWWQAANTEGVPPTYVITENVHAQRWLVQYPFFNEWALARNVTIIQHATTAKSKPDPDRGVEMLGPMYRLGQVWIPYGGYEEKILGDQFRREACSWPEGQYSDLVMHHWFFAHRLDSLLVAELAVDADEDDEDAPRWARNRQVPRFVQRRFADSLHG